MCCRSSSRPGVFPPTSCFGTPTILPSPASTPSAGRSEGWTSCQRDRDSHRYPRRHRSAPREDRAPTLRLVDQRTLLDPGHHVAELGAYFLDLVFSHLCAGGLERGLVD